jgi:transcription elongation factor S-II
VKALWKVCLAGGEIAKRVVLSDKKKTTTSGQDANTDSISFPDLNNPTRNRCLQTLYKILACDDCRDMIALIGKSDYVFSESDILNKCIQIERLMYSDNTRDYLQNVRERILILKDKGNPNLKVNIVIGEVSLNDFAMSDAKDLADEETRKKIEDGIAWSMNA